MRVEKDAMMGGICEKCSLDLAWKAASGCESPGELYVMMAGRTVKEADELHIAALTEARKANQTNEAAITGLLATLKAIRLALGDSRFEIPLSDLPGAVTAQIMGDAA